MPKRFEKGSPEATDWAKRMKEAREMKKNDALYQAKKAERKQMEAEDIPLQKQKKEQQQMKKEDRNAKKAEAIDKGPKVNVDMFGTDELILPEYYAIKSKKGYKLVNPLTQERHLSTRKGLTPFKITRRAVDNAVYIDNETEPIPISFFVPKDREKVLRIIEEIKRESDKAPINKPIIPFEKNKMRGRPEKLPKNIEYNAQQRRNKKQSAKKGRKKAPVELVIEEAPMEETKQEPIITPKKPRGRPKGVSKYTSEEERKQALNKLKYESNLKKRRERETPEQAIRRLKKEAKKQEAEKKAKAKARPNIELVIEDKPTEIVDMEGEGLKPPEIKSLLDASYQERPPSRIGDWELDDKLSTTTAVVYYNPITNDAVVAHRGTQGVTDWGNNIAYALGAYELTPRYREGKKVQDEAERKYGKKNISTLGHSQGAVLARKLGSDTKEVINVNPAYMGEKPAKNEYNIRSNTDVVSSVYKPVSKVREVLFPKYSKKHDITIPSQSINPLTEHSYDILDRIDQNKTIGVGSGLKTKKPRFVKGSQEAKDFMKALRDKKGKK